MPGLLSVPGAVLTAQRGHLFPWAPVAYGAGIAGYFALPSEPGSAVVAGLVCGAVCLGWLALRAGAAGGPVLWAAALALAGVAVGAGRTAFVAGPVLGFRYYGPVEGRVVDIDRSASDALRLTLDRVRLLDFGADEVPRRVRISLHGDQRWLVPAPGITVVATAHLSPPGGPVEPGGFDFRRHAWFERLGAVGYTRTPVLEYAPAVAGEDRVFRWRMALADRIREGLPGERGAVAAALIAGDRSAMREETVVALRAANLAHLLAISGLHMGLVAGFVFGTVRLALAAVPWVALRWPLHKIAAVAALTASGGYLILSGGNVATERAFVMVAVALAALMADRRALSLRAVAVAALIVLTLRPEALLGPGFQMSFSATVALVAAFGLLRDRGGGRLPRWIAPVLAVFLSSFVAGLATAPVAAAHFNQIARFGLVANLLAVPVMGVLVMPAGVTAALLMTVGAEGPALWIMGQGIGWILTVATRVADLPGALSHVPTPDAPVLPLFALGLLMLCLWQGRLRAAGMVPLALAGLLWWGTERPEVLVAEGGALVGVMTEEGRALSRARGGGFVAGTWLENDGDPVPQEEAAARWRLVPEGLARHVTGRVRVSELTECGAGILVANAKAPPLEGCLIFDAATPSAALTRSPDGWIVTRANEKGRPWTPP
ncbi:competence protein [Oceanicola sp. 22II-s10i]|uniref:ComEC/Rec2 family competence protein n=1 Tax=Oceanicola sp. 22II-s10i TaxID=1317116 RepID=UPI000B522900|nr:ComEC/Rec2 family competence protein [Oceanicola sp. 22II-s10i]OWU83851.1 competence protein [Oceanicola sp. 22II-s10i]